MPLIRTLLAAALVGLAAAANCLGSASSSPIYCTCGQCDSQAISVGETVSLEVKIRNEANYRNTPIENTYYTPGSTIYLPAKLVAGKQIEVVFACKNIACSDAYDDIFE